jgi:exosome complex RNA-binding protein Rrp4
MEQALAQIEEIPIIKDISFWHLIAVLACTLLGKMLNKHMEKTEKTLDNITQILNKVVADNEVQSVKIETIDKRVERLENG